MKTTPILIHLGLLSLAAALSSEFESTETHQSLRLPNYYSTLDTHYQCLNQTYFDNTNCVSSWAAAAVNVLFARACYQGNSSYPALSAQYLLNCASVGGCTGGQALQAWNFLKTNGVPKASCQPYQDTQQTCNNQTCGDGSKIQLLTTKGYRQYLGVPAIQMAILQSGPVQACMTVHQDFLAYNGGTYSFSWGGYVSYACVVLYGWYGNAWMGFNNWAPYNWQNGAFYIQMGDSGIEDDVWGGDPYYPPSS